MTPQTQTNLHIEAPDGTVIQKGSCYQAAVAALMDLPLEEVPNFIEYADDVWYSIFCDFIRDKGFEYAWSYEVPKGYSIGSGISPRARKDKKITHAVICFDGEIVHDVHPDRTGLIGPINYYETIRPRLTEAP